MNEALCSILTGESEWVYHSEGKSIKFKEDGTGELWCCKDGHFWIAAELEWKSIETSENTNEATTTVQKTGGPQLLGQLNLAITLIKRLPRQLDSQPGARDYVLNERGLTDEAFQLKKYTISIEKGNFIEPCYIGSSASKLDRSRYELRLLFDRSPYPPRSEWIRPEGGPDSNQFWNIIEFVGRESSELKRGRAMNDNAGEGWSSCTVS